MSATAGLARSSRAGLGLLLVIALCGVLAPWIAPYDPGRPDLRHGLEGPSLEHWLGPDVEGRDVASRILFGARGSLSVALAVVGCATTGKEDAEASGAKPMSAQEAKAAFAGNSVIGEIPDIPSSAREGRVDTAKYTYTAFLSQDGRVAGLGRSKFGNASDRGKWRVGDKGELCLGWSKWSIDGENCHSVYKLDDGSYKIFAPEGGTLATFKVAKGNPAKLNTNTPMEDAVARGVKTLSTAQARAALSANTMHGEIPSESVCYSVFCAEDGRLAGTARGAAGAEKDSGKWRVTDSGEVCFKWTSWLGGDEHCAAVFKKGKRYVVFDPEGEIGTIFKIDIGNIKNLPLEGDG